MAVKKKIYSYIKYPFSQNGWFSFGLSALAFILTQIIVYLAVKSKGSVSPVTAALGLSSMLIDLTAVYFTAAAFREKEKNYIFAVIGTLLSLSVLIEWIYIFSK